jgi:hypothetical protein
VTFEELFGIFEIPRQIIVNLLSSFIPAQFLNPLFPIPYAKEISLGIVLLFALISIFAGFRWIIRLVGIAFVVVGFLEGLSGGITAFVMIIGIALTVKLIRKIAGHGGEGGFGKGFGKEEKMDFGEESGGMQDMSGGSEEFKMPEAGEEEFKMPGNEMPEEKPQTQKTIPQQQIPQQPAASQKVCPYCGGPLMYVPQYQRYYCPRCRRYI